MRGVDNRFLLRIEDAGGRGYVRDVFAGDHVLLFYLLQNRKPSRGLIMLCLRKRLNANVEASRCLHNLFQSCRLPSCSLADLELPEADVVP